MSTVKYIRSSGTGRVSIGVLSDEGTVSYNISEMLYNSLGIVRGSHLCEESVVDMRYEDERYRAMKRALSILSFADNTAANLTAKLLRAGFSREVAKECTEECLRLGYINEERQLERAILNDANRSLYGREYIIKRLTAKGYRPSDVAACIDALVERGEVDFAENFARLADRCGASCEEDRKKLAYKRGYRGYDLD